MIIPQVIVTIAHNEMVMSRIETITIPPVMLIRTTCNHHIVATGIIILDVSNIRSRRCRTGTKSYIIFPIPILSFIIFKKEFFSICPSIGYTLLITFHIQICLFLRLKGSGCLWGLLSCGACILIAIPWVISRCCRDKRIPIRNCLQLSVASACKKPECYK
jgi:hypothetical protein